MTPAERPIEVGDWVEHEKRRKTPAIGKVLGVREHGRLLIVQVPGEGFGQFVPTRDAVPVEGPPE